MDLAVLAVQVVRFLRDEHLLRGSLVVLFLLVDRLGQVRQQDQLAPVDTFYIQSPVGIPWVEQFQEDQEVLEHQVLQEIQVFRVPQVALVVLEGIGPLYRKCTLAQLDAPFLVEEPLHVQPSSDSKLLVQEP